MFREGEVSPEVLAEYEKMKGEKNMEPAKEVGELEEERDLDVGGLLGRTITSEQFVKNVLDREGGDPARIDQAARAVETFWLKQLAAGQITLEQFEAGVYESVKRMLKEKPKPTAKETERKAREEERMRAIRERKAA